MPQLKQNETHRPARRDCVPAVNPESTQARTYLVAQTAHPRFARAQALNPECLLAV
jgi:hypothetical protein